MPFPCRQTNRPTRSWKSRKTILEPAANDKPNSQDTRQRPAFLTCLNHTFAGFACRTGEPGIARCDPKSRWADTTTMAYNPPPLTIRSSESFSNCVKMTAVAKLDSHARMIRLEVLVNMKRFRKTLRGTFVLPKCLRSSVLKMRAPSVHVVQYYSLFFE